MEKEKMIQLAKNLLFEPKNELFEMMNEEHEQIKKQLLILEKFDLDNIEPMTHINEEKIDFSALRDDEIQKGLNKNMLLENAALHDDDFVIIRKVLND